MSAVVSRSDTLQGLVTFVEACHWVTTPRDFTLNVYPRLAALLPHEMFAAALIEPEGQRLDYCLNLQFPDAYQRQIISPGGLLHCPVFREWRKASHPVCFDLGAAEADAFDPQWLRLAKVHGIHSIAAHGLPDGEGPHISFFTFAGIRQPRPACQRLLHLIVRALHTAVASFAPSAHEQFPAQERAPLDDVSPASTSRMSEREIEVLHWISRGKSTDETATILGISPWTVKAHVKHVHAKLDVTCRAQAVAKAFQLGLIT